MWNNSNNKIKSYIFKDLGTREVAWEPDGESQPPGSLSFRGQRRQILGACQAVNLEKGKFLTQQETLSQDGESEIQKKIPISRVFVSASCLVIWKYYIEWYLIFFYIQQLFTYINKLFNFHL